MKDTLQFWQKTKQKMVLFHKSIELKTLCNMAKKPKSFIKDYISSNIKEFESMKGHKQRELSHEELLNRDYYRGRFASKNKKGELVFNWEDKPI